MPSPYDAIVVGSGPAGGTAARYAARRGLKVLLVDKRKEIGVPVQCGDYDAHNDETRPILPGGDGWDRAQRFQQGGGHVLRQPRRGRIRMDHSEGPLRERRSGNVAVLPREPAESVRPVRPVAGPGAR